MKKLIAGFTANILPSHYAVAVARGRQRRPSGGFCLALTDPSTRRGVVASSCVVVATTRKQLDASKNEQDPILLKFCSRFYTSPAPLG